MSEFSANTSRVDVLESGKYITFISNTDHKIEVPIEYIGCSEFIKESLNMCEYDPNPEIPLLITSTPTLVVVADFMKEYTLEPFENLPKPLPKTGINECVRPYFRDLCLNLEMVSDNLRSYSKKMNEDDEEDDDDSTIVKEPRTSIVELLQASSFLRIESLKQLCTAFLSQKLKTSNFTEVKAMFKCQDLQFNYNKMKELHEQHAWCFDKKNNTSASGGSA